MKKRKVYILFIAPAFIIYSLIVIYPMVSALPYSFTVWNGLTAPRFNGIQNYIDLFKGSVISKDFMNAMFNNLEFILMQVFISIPLAFSIAYIFFSKLIGSSFYKAVIFSPHLVNVVVVGFMITLFFDPNIGILGIAARALGFSDFRSLFFVGDPRYDMLYIFIINTWKGIGYPVLLFLANLNSIPTELGESARIDGAGWFQCLTRVYIPQMIPAITNVSILTYIGGITLFEIPFVVGGVAGGVNRSADTMALFFYRNAFNSLDVSNSFGRGAAVSMVMFILIGIGALIQLNIFRRIEMD